ncbi:MAG: 4Fe-4S binding protein [Candidatus Micrarchaeia archaeon]
MIVEPIVEVAKSTLKKRTTIEFPEHREILTDNYRGIHKLDMNTCINCGACARICPNQTITMVESDEDTAFKPKGTKLFPQIDLERCLFCALCEEVCPTKCLILTKKTDLEAYDKREFIRRPEELD